MDTVQRDPSGIQEPVDLSQILRPILLEDFIKGEVNCIFKKFRAFSQIYHT